MITLKQLAQKMVKELECLIDNDELDLNPDQLEEIALIIHEPKFLGREEAAKFLGVSLNKFHELRDQGIVPLPMKTKGQKEKLYSVYELRKTMNKLSESKHVSTTKPQ